VELVEWVNSLGIAFPFQDFLFPLASYYSIVVKVSLPLFGGVGKEGFFGVAGVFGNRENKVFHIVNGVIVEATKGEGV
jgi:hypothetical protein